MRQNKDAKTVESFGDEWERFDQSALSVQESEELFNGYFATFPWDRLPAEPSGFDMGCGTGRWARNVAPRVGVLHCVDPSSAIDVARRNLLEFTNVQLHAAGVDDHCIPEGSQDFGYSLGVLHHIPDTQAAMTSCVRLLKPGAPFLVYLYYAFDNRPRWFRAIWRVSEVGRGLISRLPAWVKHPVTDAIASVVYFPLARISLLLERLGLPVATIPLSFYRHRSFYTMRTDARDRFGTPLEQRFTRAKIQEMMERSGLEQIRFSEVEPYWCASGIKADTDVETSASARSNKIHL